MNEDDRLRLQQDIEEAIETAADSVHDATLWWDTAYHRWLNTPRTIDTLINRLMENAEKYGNGRYNEGGRDMQMTSEQELNWRSMLDRIEDTLNENADCYYDMERLTAIIHEYAQQRYNEGYQDGQQSMPSPGEST